jgi:trans-aconitate methyltransferase
MIQSPNATATTEDFEFAALAEAKNYRQALFAEFRSALRGNVIEVGAGVGQMTEHLVQSPEVRHALAVEPDRGFCAQHRASFPQHDLLEGTVADLPAGTACDAILSINVLEHIQDDQAELERYTKLLRPRREAFVFLFPLVLKSSLPWTRISVIFAVTLTLN